MDHLFRHKAGQMVSALTRYLGIQNLELVEDIVQETLLKALQQWPYRGVPENPDGWLWITAKNHALDVLRREARFQKKLQGEIRLNGLEHMPPEVEAGTYPFEADQLTMMLIGCHPSLTRESQIAFVLNTVSGFSAAELAWAFLVSETTMAQRLVRTKQKLRALEIPFELPHENSFAERLEVVLDVLYLLFNEGYEAHSGEELIRKELCHEAIYLCKLVTRHSFVDVPRAHALLALMLLQTSRLEARTNSLGEMILLEMQDRSLWDRSMIQEGLIELGLSAQGELMSEFHLQAAIAAKHAQAESYASTDWTGIVTDYDALLEIAPNPIVKLNRAVAIALQKGTEAGLHELAKLLDNQSLEKYHLFHATLGALHERNNDLIMAERSYREALLLSNNESEKRFLEKKILGLTKQTT